MPNNRPRGPWSFLDDRQRAALEHCRALVAEREAKSARKNRPAIPEPAALEQDPDVPEVSTAMQISDAEILAALEAEPEQYHGE